MAEPNPPTNGEGDHLVPFRRGTPGIAAPNDLTLKDMPPDFLTTEFLTGTANLQCTARSKTRLKEGITDPEKLRCKKTAIPGGTVCIYHGGKAPQVREKAAKRWALINYLIQERIIEAIIEDEDNLIPFKELVAAAKTATEKTELMEGRATARTETQIMERRETLVYQLQSSLDRLAEGEVRRVELEEALGIEYDPE